MPRELHFRFPLPAGLHARPATTLRELAAGFSSQVTFANARNGRTANAKSVLALVATLTREGDDCRLAVAGEDEEAALRRLERFLGDEFPRCDDALPPPAPASPGESERPLPRALRNTGARVFRGTPVGGGIARARVFLVSPWRSTAVLSSREARPATEEAAAFERALAVVGGRLRGRVTSAGEATEREVARAHLAMLEDVELISKVEEAIRAGGQSAGAAVLAAAEHFTGVLRESGSAYLQERVLDLRDVAIQLVSAMTGDGILDERVALEADSVCVAESLGPAQFLALDKSRVKGLLLARGGTTSHTVILARALGIPCLTGVAGVDLALRDGQEIVVDAVRGLAVADPPADVSRFYASEMAKLRTMRTRLERFALVPGATADGRPVEVAANAASLDEVRAAFASGADGIGLFRTELLFANRAASPSEDEQARIYAEAARAAGGRSVIIRTLDVGGDKPLPYLEQPPERNPFLGVRGVRLYERHPELVSAQLRAILRASGAGRVKIMFPMVSSLEEVRTLRGMVEAEMAALVAAHVAHDPEIEIGVMVEIPALAFVLDRLADEVEFVSVGSNDLLQYFLAVDRDNEHVAGLYDPFHPGFVRLLKRIGEEAAAHGVWLGLCGELGSDPLAAPLLVGCGFDEISAGPASVPAVKAAVARCDAAACEKLALQAAAAATASEVRELLAAFVSGASERSLAGEGLVRLHAAARTREEAIRELVDLLHVAGHTDDPDALEDAVWQREDISSTAVGFGVAIPHCKSSALRTSSVALATYDDGVEWPPDDGGPVKIAILIAVADGDRNDASLRMIASLSRRLLDEDFRQNVTRAASAAEVVALLEGALAAH